MSEDPRFLLTFSICVAADANVAAGFSQILFKNLKENTNKNILFVFQF